MLCLCNNQIDGTGDLRVELDFNGMCAEGLDGILYLELTAVDLDAVLCLHGFFDILCGDGAVNSAVSTGGCSQLDDDRLQLCGGIMCILLVNFDLMKTGVFLALEFIHDSGIGNSCELLGEQEVARISVGNIDELALFALTLDIL